MWHITLVLVILFVLVISIKESSSSNNNKGSKYAKYAFFTDFLIFMAFVGLGLLAIISKYTNETRASGYDYVKIDNGMKIDKYTVTLDVDKDYKIKVTEDISMLFLDSTHHGIFKFVPEWLEYTSEDGKTISRKARLSNLSAGDEPYTIDVVKKKKRIKIGSASKMLPKGIHDYRITYVYDMDGDIYEGFDEFIFHAFGDYWDMYINNPTVIINLPEEVDLEGKIHLFADKRRKEDISSKFDISVMGKQIVIKAVDDYALYGALTVDMSLPEGYFREAESENYGYSSLIMCIICIVFTIVALVIWFFKGKDYPKGVESIEFYPPKGLDPSIVGYIYKKDTGRKLTIATIISLASKGAIKIDESGDKKDIIITKNFDVNFDKAIGRVIVFSKVKEFDSDLNSYAVDTREFINRYFPSAKSREATVIENGSEALAAAQVLIDKGIIKVKSDSINDYSDKAIKKIKESIKCKNTQNIEFSQNEKLVFDTLFEKDTTVILKQHKTLYTIFNSVSKNVIDKYADMVNEISSYKWSITVGLWLIICIILWGISYMVIKDLNPKYSYLYTVAYAANLISLGITVLMRRRTVYGENLLGQIKGFRHYLEVAEKDKLEALVEENPNYFYDILPYAYVLGVSAKWVKKFENIPLPERDMGNYNYIDTGSFRDISNGIYIPSSSSGGGSSSCGGGCSSCGGGCSSCGGGGGW